MVSTQESALRKLRSNAKAADGKIERLTKQLQEAEATITTLKTENHNVRRRSNLKIPPSAVRLA